MAKAKKSLGQHFLKGGRVVSRIISAVSPTTRDVILEIGPGHGALTRRLVELAGYVAAIELDASLADELRRTLPNNRCKIVNGDVLALDLEPLLDEAVESWRKHAAPASEAPRVRVVANLPYYISTAVIQKLIEHGPRRLFDMTLMLQEEVVDRITSAPGVREYGYLSVLVQYHCEAAKLFRVSPGSFAPPPKVWSAVVRLAMRRSPPVAVSDDKRFFSFVRVAFAHKRKTILNNLRSLQGRVSLDTVGGRCGIDLNRRAETLSLAEFAALFEALANTS